MKLLVTGGNGFIGSEFVKLSKKSGYDTHLLQKNHCDLLTSLPDDSLLKGYDVLVHCAWYTKHGKFWDSSLNSEWSKSTVKLYKKFSSLGGQYFLGMGSCAEYNWGHPRLVATDDSQLEPASVYGKSKLECFRAIEKAKGCPFSWGRVFFPYGPGEPPERFVPSLLNSLRDSKKFKIENPGIGRDFIYIKDVAKMMMWAIESKQQGPFNICSGKAHTLGEIADIIGRITGKLHLIEGLEDSAEPNDIFYGDMSEQLATGNWQPEYSLEKGIVSYINEFGMTR